MPRKLYQSLPLPPGFLPKEQPATAYVKFRPYIVEDAKFILHSWLKSMRTQYRDALDGHYYVGMERRILRLAQRDDTRVVIACDSDKQHFIYGWCVADKFEDENNDLIVHYIFVKNTYRRQGIGTALLESFGWVKGRPLQVTHWNYCLNDIKKVFKLLYNPWRLDE